MSQIVVEMSSDEAKLYRGMQKLVDQQTKMEQKFRATGQAAKGAGAATRTAAQQSQTGMQAATAGLKNYLAGWFSITAAITAATTAIREHNEERRKGLDSIDRLDEANRNLAQIAGPGELAKLQAQADRLSTKYGISRERSRALLFSAHSEKFESFAPDIARFDPIVSTEAAAVTAGQVPALFDNKISGRESTALTLAAARQSRLNFEGIARGLPVAAQGGHAAGSSPEETFALLSTLSSKFKSGEQAAERLGAFGIKVSLDEDLQGLGIVGAVQRLQADPTLKSDFLGESKELNEAFNSISQLLPVVAERQREIEAERRLVGTDKDILERGLAERLADPEFRALQEKRRATIEREISAEDAYGTGEGLRQAAEERVTADLNKEGANALERFHVNRALDVAETVSGDAQDVSIGAQVGKVAYKSSIVGLATDPTGSIREGLTLLQIIADRLGGGDNAAANAQAQVNQ